MQKSAIYTGETDQVVTGGQSGALMLGVRRTLRRDAIVACVRVRRTLRLDAKAAWGVRAVCTLHWWRLLEKIA